MSIIIEIPTIVYDDLAQHLLPRKMHEEEAAFVFASVTRKGNDVVFEYKDYLKAVDSDYDLKSAFHIELTDDLRSRLLKKAHDLKASIIEFHSHVDQKLATFSFSDWDGFSEFVPHVFWRLERRPYAAVVFTKGSFDALAWVDDPKKPKKVDHLQVGSKLLKPTGLSYKKWING